MSLEGLQVSRWQRTLSNWIAPDLVVAWGVAGLVYLGTVLEVPPGVRVALVVPGLFLVPGYVLVAALFPRRADRTDSAGPLALDRVGERERLALSFGLSVALLALLGVAVGASPWSFSRPAAVNVFVAFVAVGGLIAALRRRRVAPADRYRVPLGRWSGELRAGVGTGSAIDRTLNLAVLVVGLLALATVGYALAVPPAGQGFTNFAVLTQDGDELVAGEYPESLAPGETASLVTAVHNQEGSSTRYTVVVSVERPPAAEETAAEVELQRFQETVASGERWTRRHEVTPDLTGETLRLNYYLYRGTAPEDPDASTASHHLYLWTSVGTPTGQ